MHLLHQTAAHQKPISTVQIHYWNPKIPKSSSRPLLCQPEHQSLKNKNGSEPFILLGQVLATSDAFNPSNVVSKTGEAPLCELVDVILALRKSKENARSDQICFWVLWFTPKKWPTSDLWSIKSVSSHLISLFQHNPSSTMLCFWSPSMIQTLGSNLLSRSGSAPILHPKGFVFSDNGQKLKRQYRTPPKDPVLQTGSGDQRTWIDHKKSRDPKPATKL